MIQIIPTKKNVTEKPKRNKTPEIDFHQEPPIKELTDTEINKREQQFINNICNNSQTNSQESYANIVKKPTKPENNN